MASNVTAPTGNTQPRSIFPDPGPWLYLAAPVTFVVTLGVIIYFAVTSF